MMKHLINSEYASPQCETITFLVENAVLTSSDKEGSSLGSLDDNIYGEQFI